MAPKTIKPTSLEKISFKLTGLVGTPISVIIHSLLFIGIFSLKFFGISIEEILLILTTAVSLEAIYLAIFIQMTVNRNTASLEDVEDDLEDIQEDVRELGNDVEEISEDIEEIQTEEDKETGAKLLHTIHTISLIEKSLQQVQSDLELLKNRRV